MLGRASPVRRRTRGQRGRDKPEAVQTPLSPTKPRQRGRDRQKPCSLGSVLGTTTTRARQANGRAVSAQSGGCLVVALQRIQSACALTANPAEFPNLGNLYQRSNFLDLWNALIHLLTMFSSTFASSQAIIAKSSQSTMSWERSHLRNSSPSTTLSRTAISSGEMVVDVILSGGGSGGSEETTMDDSEGEKGEKRRAEELSKSLSQKGYGLYYSLNMHVIFPHQVSVIKYILQKHMPPSRGA